MRTRPKGACLSAALLVVLSACGRDRFMVAACRGDLAQVGDLVSRGENVNRRGALGTTALHCAAGGGYVEVTRFLLDHGASVDAREALGLTPLMVSAQNGRLETVRLLVERGADVNARGRFNVTALFLAATRGDLEVAKVLLSRGADINATTTRGETVYEAAPPAKRPAFEALLIAAQKTADDAESARKARNQAEETMKKNHCPSNLYFLGRGYDAQKCVDACPPGSVLSPSKAAWLPGARICVIPETDPVPLLR